MGEGEGGVSMLFCGRGVWRYGLGSLGAARAVPEVVYQGV